MYTRADRLILLRLQQGDSGKRGLSDQSTVERETTIAGKREILCRQLPKGVALVLSEFHRYYVKGRVFEWTFALSMFFAGLECLFWDDVISFGVFRWMLEVMSQKCIGTLLFFIGWIRISALMFNGQLLFGRRFGWGVRAVCAVLAASMWAQFALALIQAAFVNGTPSIGLPFWCIFVGAELLIAYQVGAEWKTK